jgi:hypothetical protein
LACASKLKLTTRKRPNWVELILPVYLEQGKITFTNAAVEMYIPPYESCFQPGF